MLYFSFDYMQVNFRTKRINERMHRIGNYKNLKMMVLGHHFVIQHCYFNLRSARLPYEEVNGIENRGKVETFLLILSSASLFLVLC